MEPIRTISIKLPWPLLMCFGAKLYETRSWKTDYRGVIAIHASKAFGHDELYDCKDPRIAPLMKEHGYYMVSDLPRGCIVGIGILTDCIPTEQIPVEQQVLGNFARGRYGWKIEEIKMLKNPIPATGQLYLWAWEQPMPLDQLEYIDPASLKGRPEPEPEKPAEPPPVLQPTLFELPEEKKPVKQRGRYD